MTWPTFWMRHGLCLDLTPWQLVTERGQLGWCLCCEEGALPSCWFPFCSLGLTLREDHFWVPPFLHLCSKYCSTSVKLSLHFLQDLMFPFVWERTEYKEYFHLYLLQADEPFECFHLISHLNLFFKSFLLCLIITKQCSYWHRYLSELTPKISILLMERIPSWKIEDKEKIRLCTGVSSIK